MTRGNRSTRVPHGRPGALVAFALAVTVLVPLVEAAHRINTNVDPRVTDGAATLMPSDLSRAEPLRISGLRPNQVDSAYAADGNSEFLECEARLYYTLNGAAPTADSSFAILTCQETPQGPAEIHNYRGVLLPGALKGGPANPLVTFFIRVDLVNPNQEFFDDTNGGKFYKYRLDRSRAQILNPRPAPVPGSSVPDGVTSSGRPPLSFVVQDEPLEAPFDWASLALLVDGADRTSLFDCAPSGTNARSCAFNYTRAGGTFAWSEKSHTVAFSGHDATGNEPDAVNGTFTFRVDRTPPTVGSIGAVPFAGIPASGGKAALVGVGQNVTVRVTVKDPQLDENGTTNVVAQLFNATLGIQSGTTALRFNPLSGEWSSNDVRIPTDWPTGRYGVTARVQASDLAGNTGVGTTNGPAFEVDGSPPNIVEGAPPRYWRGIGHRVNATVTDVGSGLNASRVFLYFSNLTGAFRQNVTGVPRVDGFYQARMTNTSAPNFTYVIPAALHDTTIAYFVLAEDYAGGTANSPARIFTVDTAPPFLNEVDPQPFRGPPPFSFRLEARDNDSGVNASSVRLYASSGAPYVAVNMTYDNITGLFTGSVDVPVLHEDEVRYYFESLDLAGNLRSLGSRDAPRTVVVDLEPPRFVLSAPSNATGPEFEIEWNATDALSGVDTFTIQARVRGSDATTPWVTIANRTRATNLTVCAEGGKEYEFRGFATDRAGNTGGLTEGPSAVTRLDPPGCPESIRVSAAVPNAQPLLDARFSDNLTVRWTASAERTLTPAHELRIDVLFSPDDGRTFVLLGSDLPNTGLWVRPLDLPSCASCLVKVRARSLSGFSAQAIATAFELRSGSPTADIDHNGMPDEWELRYSGALGRFDPDADLDGDGLTNLEESRAQTDPEAADTDGDGASDLAEARAGTDPRNPTSKPSRVDQRTEQFTAWYMVVPGLTLLAGIVYFLGLARRW